MSYTKYRNIKTIIDGITFSSKHEAKDYSELKLRLKAGEIKDLELQPKFVLQEKFIDRFGVKHREIAYRADFKYEDLMRNEIVVQDSKGVRTKEFILKKKLFLLKYPEYVFIES